MARVQHLLRAAQHGDQVALDRLLKHHRQGVYRYGLQVCRTTEDAEDAVQETMWAATRALHTFRGSAAAVVSWLFTIVRRECLRLHARRRRAEQDVDISAEEPRDPEATVGDRQLTSQLAAAFSTLSPLDREVLILRDIRELTAPAAAAALGISVQALKSRLHRARLNLRHSLSAPRTHPAPRP